MPGTGDDGADTDTGAANPDDADTGTGTDDEARTSSVATATYNAVTDTITVTAGDDVTMSALSRAVGDPDLLDETAPGEWTLGANLEIGDGSSLELAAPAVRWLKMASGPPTATDPAGYVSIKVLGGGFDVDGVCITSWDAEQESVDTNHADGRAFLLARDGGQMTIDKSELHYLGHLDTEAYGLSWRLEGSGGEITNSVISNLYFGMYSFEVGGLKITDNEVFSSVVYGIDPHTKSHNLQIQRNVVHHNGKHGIILAEDCVDSVVTDNIVYENLHHGIVLFLRSDRNRVENNESFGNAAQGVNVNQASGNVVRLNKIYNNTESGVALYGGTDNVVERNEIRANEQDGIRLVSASTKVDVRDNMIGNNARYGVYVDSKGPFTLAGNTIFGSRAGVTLFGGSTMPPGKNSIFKNTEDVRTGN